MQERLTHALEEKGYQSRVVSIERLPELREEIDRDRGQGLLDDEVYRAYFSAMSYERPAEVPSARSIVVVAYPDPPVRFAFQWKGRSTSFTVPPTYLLAQAKDSKAMETLGAILAPAGHRVAIARVPRKLLAARSGLAFYGLNNIAYVPGLGSFCRLVSFFTDAPCEKEDWGERRLLERCDRCVACLRGCPTGAISRDRFVIRAGRCLTFWTERPTAEPFPGWIERSWHNCLVGCMRCQRVCPENRRIRDWLAVGPSFSEEETERLLAWSENVAIPEPLGGKLKASGLDEYLDVLPRNLRTLLETSGYETS